MLEILFKKNETNEMETVLENKIGTFLEDVVNVALKAKFVKPKIKFVYDKSNSDYTRYKLETKEIIINTYRSESLAKEFGVKPEFLLANFLGHEFFHYLQDRVNYYGFGKTFGFEESVLGHSELSTETNAKVEDMAIYGSSIFLKYLVQIGLFDEAMVMEFINKMKIFSEGGYHLDDFNGRFRDDEGHPNYLYEWTLAEEAFRHDDIVTELKLVFSR